jgi:hypothetical protein
MACALMQTPHSKRMGGRSQKTMEMVGWFIGLGDVTVYSSNETTSYRKSLQSLDPEGLGGPG